MDDQLDMRGRWDDRYRGLDPTVPVRYGGAETYQMAADFLADVDVLEDWGCGSGGFRPFFRGKTYVGVDGSQTPFADVVADLQTYRSSPDGILLRHVLEHNYGWRAVLENAVASFRKKLCIILFTPLKEAEEEIRHNRDYGVDVPDLSLPGRELFDRLDGLIVRSYYDMPTESQYGSETVIFATRLN